MHWHCQLRMSPKLSLWIRFCTVAVRCSFFKDKKPTIAAFVLIFSFHGVPFIYLLIRPGMMQKTCQPSMLSCCLFCISHRKTTYIVIFIRDHRRYPLNPYRNVILVFTFFHSYQAVYQIQNLALLPSSSTNSLFTSKSEVPVPSCFSKPPYQSSYSCFHKNTWGFLSTPRFGS